jgi:hypothetical protein
LLSRGHALTVEFLGTPGVMPRMLMDQGTTASEAYFSQRVLYEDLWPGISLTFGLSPKADCEATYVLVPGADAGKIRLRYNVPVKLQPDGTLKFRFSTGSITESAPEAWQEVNGGRVSATVSFTVVRGEVGFTVGSYDPSVPLTIDPKYSGVSRLVPGVRLRLFAAFTYFASSRETVCRSTRLIHQFKGCIFNPDPASSRGFN